MLRYILRFPPFKCGIKSAVPKLRRCLGVINFCGVVHAHTYMKKVEDNNFEEEIKRASKQGENYLTQLMCTLRTVILQTSIEYQECLITQIEITKENTMIGPVGEHWDRLTGFRIKGNELKDELTRYEALARNITDIVTNEATLIFFENKIDLEQLNNELRKLQKLCNEQLLEINKYEKELLKINCDSVVNEIPAN